MSPAAVRTLRVPLGRARNTPTSWRELRPAAVATRCAPVPIREAHGGLALQRTLDQAGWCVVHVASGSRVTPTYRLQREARAVQRALLALDGLDWTWPRARLQGLPRAQRARIVALVTRPLRNGE